MQDPMEMGRAMQDLMAQAQGWIATYSAWLVDQGLGFTDDDLAVIEQAAAADPAPPGMVPGAPPSADVVADAERVREQAMNTVYPPGGIPADDPRLEPIEGVPLVAIAVGSRAIGFATDPALIERVAGALGYPKDRWDRAGVAWSARTAADMVLAVLYGQLYANATLPRRGG